MISHFFIGLCAATIILAVFLNFALVNTRTKKEVKSAVATATMALFFAAFAVVLRNHIGDIVVPPEWMGAFEISGCVLVLFGTVVNVAGRLCLKDNWGDHIRIYENHTLITNGVYRYMRHPLYSGLFFFGYGACLVYTNYLGAVLLTLIFLPMMYYRARQEEKILTATFPGYAKYKKETGMFFPRLSPPKR